MLNLGMVRPGETIYIPFHTFDSNDPSASVTITGLATTDIEVYKDGSNTARASDAGYALLGTDGIDEFGTGVHGFSIDLADNTTANFYEAGSRYFVVIASITVDAATVNFVAATFTIGYPGALVNTTIATLSSQTSFTLEDASLDASAYVGCPVVIHDLASAVQVAIGYISAYAVTTKTVTLAADPGIFTMAAGDHISIFPPANVQAVAGTTQTAGDIPALVTTVDTVVDGIQTDLDNGTDGLGAIKGDTAAILTDTADMQPKLGTPAADVSADIAAVKAETALIVADTNELQTDDVPGLIAGLNDPTAASIADAVWDELQSAHVTVGSFGEIATEIASVLADTNELQTDDIPGLIAALNDPTAATIAAAVWDALQSSHVTVGSFGEIATEVAAILVDTSTTLQAELDGIQADTEDIQSRLPAALVGGAMDADVSAIQAGAITAAAIATDAIGSDELAAGAAQKIRDEILPTQNVAFGNLVFLFVAASDHVTPVTGASGTGVTRSIDGGAFGAGTGTLAEIGNGIYQYDASQADMNGGVIIFRFTGTGGTPGAPDDAFVTIVTGGGV